MAIKKVHIENFRSIKEIEFAPKEITGLVGPNNVGKSNILHAIDSVLGFRWPISVLNSEDKHPEFTENPIEIKLEFDEPILKDYYGNLHDVYGYCLNYEGQDRYNFSCLDRSGDIITVGKYKNNLSVDNDLREQLPSICVTAGTICCEVWITIFQSISA